jgi:hypothetical protein
MKYGYHRHLIILRKDLNLKKNEKPLAGDGPCSTAPEGAAKGGKDWQHHRRWGQEP